MNRARTFEKTPAGRAELDIGVARIYVNMATAEKQFGAPAGAAEARGMAVVSYQSLTEFADARDPEVRRHIETAYGECLPLLAELEKWEDVLQAADQVLSQFARGPYAVEARALRTTARTRLMAAGKLPPEAAGAEPPAATNTPTATADATTNATAGAGAPAAPVTQP
jgi:hypothetical protein